MNPIFLFQNILIAVSLAVLFGIPAFSQTIGIEGETRGLLFMVSHIAVFLVMIIRPLADIFSNWLWLRKLVILRKGFGIFSASVIVGFIINSIATSGVDYITSFFSIKSWSFENFSFFARTGDVTGLILLLTSNRLSQKLLKQNWKRIQRLSYAYFYAGATYAAFALEDSFALYTMFAVTNITVLAWAIKIFRKNASV